MRITLKTLQQDTFTVEIDPSQTIKCLKEKIEKLKGDDFPAQYMKLMYAGKFLMDTKRISDYNLEEKKFVIVLVKKTKAALAREYGENEDNDELYTIASNSLRDRALPRFYRLRNSDNSHLSEAEREQRVRQLMEMGYPRDEVEAALRASYYNLDRAVEYIITGNIPSSSNSNDSESDDTRSVFGSSPESQSNASVPVNVSELARQVAVFASPTSPNEHAPQSVMVAANQDGAYFNDHAEENQQQAAALVANLRTPQDNEAIERLQLLGFPERQATEAYFACERNENSAADFLFSQNYDP